jgi:hypothetical protein
LCITAAGIYVMVHEGRHRLDASPEEVWDAMGRLDRFEGWWGWLSAFSVSGDGLVPGSVLEGVVSPPIPYRMRVRVTIGRCIPAREVEAVVSGDLAGPARLELERDGPDGTGTLARTWWELEMRQWPMRMACRVGKPMLRFAHDRVVDMTVAGFRRQIAQISRGG